MSSVRLGSTSTLVETSISSTSSSNSDCYNLSKSPNKVTNNNSAADKSSSNVQVVVRARPKILPREANSPILIQMSSDDKEITLLPKSVSSSSDTTQSVKSVINNAYTSSDIKSFQFDHSLWSVRPTDNNYKSQKQTFELTGKDLIQHTLSGFNTCILAYGQTGSGKSYTMMGGKKEDQHGIIPQSCKELWDHVQQLQSLRKRFYLKVSYFEIYNEQVHDLLAPNTESEQSSKNSSIHQVSRMKLKVRENPHTGPYVEGLTEYEITELEDFNKFLHMGNLNRTVAQTKMNDNSSRSHAVFSINLKIREFGINIMNNQTLQENESKDSVVMMDDDYIKETNSSLRLVDLAGSERVTSTGATGVRMKEGTNINKSLTTLGRVILSLSGRNEHNSISSLSKPPYRDSVLTWLLKENLGGNSKTVMIACISPCDYEETLSTLRYATLTQKVRLSAKVNIDEIHQRSTSTNERMQRKQMEDELAKMKLEIDKLASKSISETQKNEEIIHQITNLSKFFEDRLSIQTEKYQIVKQELIRERQERKRLHANLDILMRELNVNDLRAVYVDLEKEMISLGTRSEKLKVDMALDLEKFAPENLEVNV